MAHQERSFAPINVCYCLQMALDIWPLSGCCVIMERFLALLNRVCTRHRLLLLLLISFLVLIAYDVFFGRVLRESHHWIRRRVSSELFPRLTLFSNVPNPSNERISNLTSFLQRQKHVHYIDIGATYGARALAVAMVGRTAVVWPRNEAARRHIGKMIETKHLNNSRICVLKEFVGPPEKAAAELAKVRKSELKLHVVLIVTGRSEFLDL